MIVTIDGPSGTGKTTIAQKVAERLGITYVDTGAMYRAVTYAILLAKIDFSDTQKIQKLLHDFHFMISVQDGQSHYFANGKDVTEAIRSESITRAVSEISAMKPVRDKLWQMQRDIGQARSTIFEGRDMGSVVFPEAEVKVFLDASPLVRAERRLKEMRDKRPEEVKGVDLHSMEKELKRRDEYDSRRALAPLVCPKGAKKIDTTKLTIDEVVEKILTEYRRRAKKLLPAWFKMRDVKCLYRFVNFLSYYVFKIFYRHKVYGLEHFTKRGGIIAPNHSSYFDPPITSISWPNEVHFLARESLFRPFLFGRFIRALNSHPVRGDVGDITVFKTLISLIEEGKQVVLFPEGGRMKDGQLGEIKPGIGMLITRSKGVIIPTYIHGAYEIWPPHKKFPKLFRKTACVFGTPILYENFTHLGKKEKQVAINTCLAKAMRELKSWYDSGAKGIPP